VSSASIAHGNERPWTGVHAVRDVRNLPGTMYSVNEIHPVTQTGLFTATLSRAPLVLLFLFLFTLTPWPPDFQCASLQTGNPIEYPVSDAAPEIASRTDT